LQAPLIPLVMSRGLSKRLLPILGRDDLTVVAPAAVAHRQHSVTTAAVPPTCVGPEATMEVARWLLYNPPIP
jgi:hypothetical protein